MRWQHGLKLGFWTLMGIVFLPMIALLVGLCLLIVLILLICTLIKDLFVEGWNHLPRNRQAIARAREALQTYLPQRDGMDWHVAYRDWHRCFVQVTLASMTQPPTIWLCAVWDQSGQVDDLGTWQFHHGVGIRHAVRAYTRSQAAGQTWPKSTGELVEQVPAAELPAGAKPGLHPHQGTVLIRRDNKISLYPFADVLGELLESDPIEGVEAYDVEGRHLRLQRTDPAGPIVVLAPMPPTRPDKVFIERLRHYLISQTTDPHTIQLLQQMLPAELADYGIRYINHEELTDTDFE